MAEAAQYDTDSESEETFFDAVESGLKLLPTELVQAILSHATDALSLSSMAQCCSLFHCAFLADQDRILQSVLRNEIAADVLPDALVTFASANLLRGEDLMPHRSAPSEECDYLSDLRYLAELGPVSWSIPKALAISKLHDDVSFFAFEFASTLATNSFRHTSNKRSTALTSKERNRIQRSFYRYELFCNLSRKGATSSEDECRKFLNKFAPWENEQLASIYEHLFSRLSTAFNDVAEHDVEWGERSIPWLDDESAPDNYYKEHLLSLGLNYLRRLVSARTYEERYKLLELEPEDTGLYSGVSVAADAYNGIPLADLTEDERAFYIKPPYFEDSDIGPAEAWRWAYQGGTTSNQYFMPSQCHLRALGYVMYDYDRLCTWPEFYQPFSPPPPKDVESLCRNHQKMTDSWGKRSILWLEGARGWWSEEDKSKLVWQNRIPRATSVPTDKWGFPKPGVSQIMRNRDRN